MDPVDIVVERVRVEVGYVTYGDGSYEEGELETGKKLPVVI